MDDAWDEKAVFAAARELPPERRAEFLRQACPDDARRERIEILIRNFEEGQKENFLFRDMSVNPLGDSQDADHATQTAEALAPIHEFELIRRLGSGGFGNVFLAYDTKLLRQVAIKVLKDKWNSAEEIKRFEHEARAAASLKHPGIVPVFTSGSSPQGYYIVSEYVEGQTLHHFIKRQKEERQTGTPQTSSRDYCREVAEIVAGIADALEAAHRAKIIHRDIKPANILLEGGKRPRLTDFGIAKQLGSGETKEVTRAVGTIGYMSPEQAEQESAKAIRIDHRSDVFSLGVVLYELLALKLPFSGEGGDVFFELRQCQPIRLRRRDARVPKDLETICHKCLEKEPARRYPSAAHLAADLRAFLTNQPILASPPGVWRRMWRFARLHRVTVVAAVVVMMAGTSASVIWHWHRAYEGTMGIISVAAPTLGSKIWLHSTDPYSLELARPQLLGVTPLNRVLIPPGRYRITIVEPDDWAFAESEFEIGASSTLGSSMVEVVGDAASTVAAPPSVRAFTVVWKLTLTRSNPSEDEMVFFPSGEYLVGSPQSEHPLFKARMVALSDFYIDRREVSNKQYEAFVKSTGHRPPEFWSGSDAPGGLADRPVVDISLADAEAYARWCGKRLPTYFEWQAATRTAAGFVFPWGNTWDSERDDLEPNREMLAGAYLRTPAELMNNYVAFSLPVFEPTEGTSVGVMAHVFDNVREMTSTVIAPAGGMVLCGRCWVDPPQQMTLAESLIAPPEFGSFRNGFRCARSNLPNASVRRR